MKFTGIIPAVVTPFADDGQVNRKSLAALVDRLVREGVGGLFVCGSTGEWWLLTDEERMAVLETAVEAAAGRTRIMVHVGSPSTASSVRLARHAEKAGADAISALPPIGRPYPANAVWGFFKAIADSTRLPLYLYHLPQLYGDLITIDRFADAVNEMPTLAGAKFSSYRIDDMIKLKVLTGDRLNIISGCGEQLLSAMACGADGSICSWYNIVPRLGNKIIECVQRNDIPTARELEYLLVSFAIHCVHDVIGYLKWLIGRRGIPCGVPRGPIPCDSEEKRQAALPGIEATGIFKWMI